MKKNSKKFLEGSGSSVNSNLSLWRFTVNNGIFGASLVAQSGCQCRTQGFKPWVRKIPWREKWQPTPVLPGGSHGQRSLVGYSSWDYKELDMT